MADAYGADYMELLSIAGYICEESEITIIKRALKRTTPTNKEAMIKLLRTAFPEFFEPV